MLLGLKIREHAKRADDDSQASHESVKLKQLRARQAKATAARLKAEEDALAEEIKLQESLERHTNASQKQDDYPALDDQRHIPLDPEEAATLWEKELALQVKQEEEHELEQSSGPPD